MKRSKFYLEESCKKNHVVGVENKACFTYLIQFVQCELFNGIRCSFLYLLYQYVLHGFFQIPCIWSLCKSCSFYS